MYPVRKEKLIKEMATFYKKTKSVNRDKFLTWFCRRHTGISERLTVNEILEMAEKAGLKIIK